MPAELTQSRLKELLSFDPETGLFTRRTITSNCVRVGDVAGTITQNGYRRIEIDDRPYLAHRLAWLYVHGIWPTNQIDHRNGMRDDNRITNLREANHTRNGQNRKINTNSTSGFKGVYWSKQGKKWRARIKFDGKHRSLGCFSTPEEASAAYEKASSELFGEFNRQQPQTSPFS